MKSRRLVAAALCLGCNAFDATQAAGESSSVTVIEAGQATQGSRRATFWKRRIAADPADPVVRVRAGQALLQLARERGDHGLNREAEHHLRQAVTLGLRDYDTLTALAFALVAQHRFREAAVMATQARDTNPHRQTAWAALGDARFGLGDFAGAQDAWNRLIERDRGLFALSRRANLAFARGEVQIGIGNLEEAAEVGLIRGVSASEVARVLVLAGDADFQRGRFEAAATRYRRALELAPGSYLALEHLAELRAAEGRLVESRALYEQVLDTTPQPDLLEAYGDVLAALGDASGARRVQAQALAAYRAATEAGDPSWYRQLALFLTDRHENPVDALEWARRDLEQRPTPASHVVLAWVLSRGGRHDAAVQALSGALGDRRALDADLTWRAGLVSRDAGLTEQARTLLRAALKLRGEHPHADVIAAALEMLDGNGNGSDQPVK